MAGRGAAGQLERFPAQHATRNANAIALGEALAEIPGLRAQKRDERMDSQGNYCFVFHFDHREFANMPLRRFEEALEAEGIPLGVSYPSLSDLELFRTAHFAPTRRSLAARDGLRAPAPARRRARRGLDGVARAPHPARRSRPRPAGRRAAARIHAHAAAIMEKLPIGAGA